MDGLVLRSRAIAFAMCAGTVAFILTLAATFRGHIESHDIASALIAGSVCGVLCWAAVARIIAIASEAIDAAATRLGDAANGDLQGDVPRAVAHGAAPLGEAMTRLFRQLDARLESVHRLAMFDAVTGLANRTNFRRTGEELLAERTPGTLAALFFIDLDRFKAVNDSLGHAMGDVLLAMVAHRLRGVAEQRTAESNHRAPLIGRLAGDEFTMFFPELRRAGDADRIGRAILAALSQSFDLAEQQVEIGASVGIALAPDHGAGLAELMRAADAAMYHAKAGGRGRVEHFTEALAADIADRAQLEADLRTAIAERQFELVYQPQVSSTDGTIVAAEALLRWRHPDGLRLPASFLQRAEETGLMVEIGDWVIASVAETISRWGRLGIAQRMTVNISPRQLDHASFFRRLREAMHAADAPARLLELELTETLATQCSPEVVEAIAALRADGASIAIDDFGTGISNLRRLRNLPVDRVKLDPSLIEHVAERAEACTIAQAVISLIHGLGCEAVAEGIETPAQAEMLRVLGCDILQGYAIAEPMPEDEFLIWLRESVALRRRPALGFA